MLGIVGLLGYWKWDRWFVPKRRNGITIKWYMIWYIC